MFPAKRVKGNLRALKSAKNGVYSRGLFYTRCPAPNLPIGRPRPQVSVCKVFIMRFHTRLIVPSIVSLIALQLVVPQGQPAARAEESELVLKTADEEAKPETERWQGRNG